MNTWVCEECGEINSNNRLFCINRPTGSSKKWCNPSIFKCLGKHPDYWELTKDWPSHRYYRGMHRTYYSFL